MHPGYCDSLKNSLKPATSNPLIYRLDRLDLTSPKSRIINEPTIQLGVVPLANRTDAQVEQVSSAISIGRSSQLIEFSAE